MTAEEKKEALLRWNEHCQRLLRLTSKRKPETEAERKKNIARALKDYDYFCRRYLRSTGKCGPFSNGRADMPSPYTWTWESPYG